MNRANQGLPRIKGVEYFYLVTLLIRVFYAVAAYLLDLSLSLSLRVLLSRPRARTFVPIVWQVFVKL